MFFNVPKTLPSPQKRFSSPRKPFQASKNLFRRFENFSKSPKTFFNASKTLQSPQKRFSSFRRTGGGRPSLSFNICLIIIQVLYVDCFYYQKKRREAPLINKQSTCGEPPPCATLPNTANAHAPYGVSWQPSLVAQKKLWFVRRWCEKLLALFSKSMFRLQKYKKTFKLWSSSRKKMNKYRYFSCF